MNVRYSPVRAFAATALGIELGLSALSYCVGLSSAFRVDPFLTSAYAIAFVVACFKGIGDARPRGKFKGVGLGDGMEASPEAMLAQVARRRMKDASVVRPTRQSPDRRRSGV